MLHIKFQDHQTFSSLDEEFQILFTIYEDDCYLGHVTQIPRTSFDFSTPLILYMQFCFNQLRFRKYFKTTKSEGPRSVNDITFGTMYLQKSF